MAVYTHRKVVTVTWEYRVPRGSAVEELAKAGAAARNHYRTEHSLHPEAALSDDWAVVTSDDDDVIIRFEAPHKPGGWPDAVT